MRPLEEHGNCMGSGRAKARGRQGATCSGHQPGRQGDREEYVGASPGGEGRAACSCWNRLECGGNSPSAACQAPHRLAEMDSMVPACLPTHLPSQHWSLHRQSNNVVFLSVAETRKQIQFDAIVQGQAVNFLSKNSSTACWDGPALPKSPSHHSWLPWKRPQGHRGLPLQRESGSQTQEPPQLGWRHHASHKGLVRRARQSVSIFLHLK